MGNNGRRIKRKNIAAAVLCVIIVCCMIYLGVTVYFLNKFLPGTEINGMDCSGKTVNQVETILKDMIDAYEVKVLDMDGNVEVLSAEQLGIKYQKNSQLEQIKEEQNSFAWIISWFLKQEVEIELNYSYNQTVVKAALYDLECMKTENQTEPVSAKIEIINGEVIIIEEVVGKKINVSNLTAAVCECIEHMDEIVDLNEAECYTAPEYTTKSPEVINAYEQLCQYLEASITYELDDTFVVLDKEQIIDWISVDAAWNTSVSDIKMDEFISGLAETYDMPDEPLMLVSPNGKEVAMEGTKLGRKVGVEAEKEQLIADITAGKVVTRSPVLSEEGTPEGEVPWGNTYIEVDLEEQHLWYIENGEIVLECDVVTGKPSTPTPTGMYRIREKMEDKVLRGAVQSDGSYEYETEVNYWLRITWSGVGFHDATWQDEFGGQRYTDGYGSHGCINMPLDSAKKLYGLVDLLDVVVIHE